MKAWFANKRNRSNQKGKHSSNQSGHTNRRRSSKAFVSTEAPSNHSVADLNSNIVVAKPSPIAHLQSISYVLGKVTFNKKF